MDDGSYMCLTSPAYYVPEARRLIFSPQRYFQTKGKQAESRMNHLGISLSYNGKVLTVPHNTANNLPLFKAYIGDTELSHETQVTCVTNDSNKT